MKVLLVGGGRMGSLVERLAPAHSCEVAGVLTSANNARGEALEPDRWADVDVAIDFSTAEALRSNLPRLAALRLNVVLGTTGWRPHEAELRRVVADAGIGVVAAPNFSPGMNLFEALVEMAGRLFAPQDEYGAWIHELHHAAKRDAPSGTALALKRALERALYTRPVDVAHTRAGHMPGTHVIGFDGPAETITLTHAVRDRSTFAHGALQAARWVSGRRGWFSMRDVLGLE
jgi:4-hydroxy-tetrahydrodipicolinate reductase